MTNKQTTQKYVANFRRVRFGYQSFIEVRGIKGNIVEKINMEAERISIPEALVDAENRIKLLEEYDSWAEAA